MLRIWSIEKRKTNTQLMSGESASTPYDLLTVLSVPETGNSVFVLDRANRNNSGRRDIRTKGLPGSRMKVSA
jgi:hypothetical protein